MEGGVPICRICHFIGSDLRFLGCGCTLHARCLPVNLVVSGDPNQNIASSTRRICPGCKAAPVDGIQIFPMTVELLDCASQIRRKTSSNTSTTISTTTTAASTFSACSEIQAEAPYLFAASSTTVSTSFSQLNQRTGRWTDEETDFVDFLVHAFDHGSLPMAAGVRLNDFLCSVLMCKASRLTKKMKNARLSMRVYEIHPQAGPLDCEMMTTMQEKFLLSIEDEATRFELRFVMDKAWRQNVSNLCLQVGYPNLDASVWVASLDAMESRAAQAEENIRKARRARMGLMTTSTSMLPDHVPAVAQVLCPIPSARNFSVNSMNGIQTRDRQDSCASAAEALERSHISNDADRGHFKSSSFEDFTNIFHRLQGESTDSVNLRKAAKLRNSSGSFLDEVLAYIQTQNLPFQHVDVWVPSHRPDHVQESKSDAEDVCKCLLHSGHGTRCDLDPTLFQQFHQFGDYSANFSFSPGVGLPGRVFQSGKPSWECRLDQSDVEHFPRSDIAKIYAIKTGLGIPLDTESFGCIVVILYSVQDIPEDPKKVEKWMSDFSRFGPRPQWKLVVEAGYQALAPRFDGTCKSDQNPYKPGIVQDLGYSSISFTDSVSSQNVATKKRAMSQDNAISETISRSVSNSSVSTRDHSNTETVRDQEIAMAKLLGDHMPPWEVSISAPSVSPHYYMTLRLLLLRSPDDRSREENELIDLIRKGYNGYVQDKTRSSTEIAQLLVKDWFGLKLAAASTPAKHDTATKSKGSEVALPPSHSLVGWFSSTGTVLPCLAPVLPAPSRHAHLFSDVYGDQKKRRLLDDLTDAINIVDENESSDLIF